MITVGKLIEWVNEQEENCFMERILWISADSKMCASIRLNPPNTEQTYFPEIKSFDTYVEALENGKLIIRTIDPYIRLGDENSYNENDKKLKERAWNLIQNIVSDEPDIYDPKLRWAIVSDEMKKTNVHDRFYYKYLKRYWAGGKREEALYPPNHRKGAPGKSKKDNGIKRGRPSSLSVFKDTKLGINVTDEIRGIFKLAVKQFYHNRSRFTLPMAYNMMIEKYFNIGHREKDGISIPILPPSEELPSYWQFKSWYYANNSMERKIKSREGTRRFALSHRAVLGSTQQIAFGPGSVFQIDATLADVYLVNRFNRRQIIGRPVIYIIIDAFSRMIVGMYVGLEGPSWVGAQMALANAFEDKVQFCKQYGIDITEDQWPCHFLPKSILADNGELKSKASDNVVTGFRIPLSTAPPYRAEWKPIVEQNFRLLNLKSIHWLPGAINKRHRERGEPDHRLDSKMDLYEFTQVLIMNVLEHNNEKYMDYYQLNEAMLQDDIDPYPINIWNWGIANRNGHLRSFSSDLVRYHLLPKANATVTESGIRFKGMHYSCEKAFKEGWFIKARANGTWKIQASYDFRNTDVIYIPSGDGHSFERCELLEREERYFGKRLEEVMDMHEYGKVKTEKSLTRKQQSNAVYKGRTQALIDQATQKTDAQLKENPMSNNKRVSHIRENRASQKEELRKEEAFDLKKPTPKEKPAEVIPLKKEETPLAKPFQSKTNAQLRLLEDLDDE